MLASTVLFGSLLALAAPARAGFPAKIYGVNLGSWLLIEPWMLPQEWINMGGQQCSDCSKCIASEFAFAKAYPSTVDAKFNTHWTTWFTQQDVDRLVKAGINTVRIPLGYWIVEDLVDRSTEFYPRGGLNQLKRGLRQLKAANIAVILDHHALPGVQAVNQQFAGRCTSDVKFYTDYNYQRALTWTSVMTTLAHTDADFASVAAIHAVNEPIMDASQTPNYGNFQKNFVKAVRAAEASLGIHSADSGFKYSGSNFTEAVHQLAEDWDGDDMVISALTDAISILLKMKVDINAARVTQAEPLTTNFMDINWQYNNPPNPADAANGPQNYDNHLYYSFGGVADPNEDAYLSHLCNLDRIEQDAAKRNSPLYFGEWSLATQFGASDDFLKRWADAQKLQYSKDAGWIFWNFKIEKSSRAGDTARQWSYFEGLDRGYFTLDPSKYNNPRVCDDYV